MDGWVSGRQAGQIEVADGVKALGDYNRESLEELVRQCSSLMVVVIVVI